MAKRQIATEAATAAETATATPATEEIRNNLLLGLRGRDLKSDTRTLSVCVMCFVQMSN